MDPGGARCPASWPVIHRAGISGLGGGRAPQDWPPPRRRCQTDRLHASHYHRRGASRAAAAATGDLNLAAASARRVPHLQTPREADRSYANREPRRCPRGSWPARCQHDAYRVPRHAHVPADTRPPRWRYPQRHRWPLRRLRPPRSPSAAGSRSVVPPTSRASASGSRSLKPPRVSTKRTHPAPGAELLRAWLLRARRPNKGVFREGGGRCEPVDFRRRSGNDAVSTAAARNPSFFGRDRPAGRRKRDGAALGVGLEQVDRLRQSTEAPLAERPERDPVGVSLAEGRAYG